MLGKFKSGNGWILPLAAHCSVHALFTLVICLFFDVKKALIFAAFDFIIHFIMDRIKASPKLLGQFHALSRMEFIFITEMRKQGVTDFKQWRICHNKIFWMSLGFDQMVHHLTHYFIIYKILN